MTLVLILSAAALSFFFFNTFFARLFSVDHTSLGAVVCALIWPLVISFLAVAVLAFSVMELGEKSGKYLQRRFDL